MLKPDEYAAIKVDYDRISRSYFPKSYFHSPDMRFSASDALFPTGVLAAQITAEFDTQCRLLCYGSPPKWVEVQERLLQLRDLL